MSLNRKTVQEQIPVIVLTGGGSGGHITPLLSLAHALKQKNKNVNIVYIGHKGDKFDTLQETYHDFDFVSFLNGGKFRRYHGESFLRQLLDFKTLLLNIRDFFKFVGSINIARRILKKAKPDVVFSKGGFVGVPVGLIAHMKRIPIVTHDSDIVPGLANKIIGRWAAVHTTGMPVEFYNHPKKGMKYVGIPVDSRIETATQEVVNKYKKQLGINAASKVLLIAGGSLGARDINEKVLQVALELLTKHPDLHIVHIAGEKNEEEVKSRYENLLKGAPNKRVTIMGFTTDFYKYSGVADLIITRAGATQLAEFAVAGKACILIPSPFLAGGHQVKNAEQLKKLGAVEVVENDAPARVLFHRVEELLLDTKKRHELAEKLGETSKANASEELARILLDIATKK